MISIIIPANNEAGVIGVTLSTLLKGLRSDEIEVVVVCNGCTDDTAMVARQISGPVRIVEATVASKTAALNIGDKVAIGFPRFYMDADIRLQGSAVRRISDAITTGRYALAAPRLRMDLASSDWVVRAYYKVWLTMPYVQSGFVGTGVYALSEAGRKRFESFPEIIADDEYVRRLFRPEERILVSDCEAVVNAPVTMSGLIKIKTRSRLGRYQLRRRFPELFGSTQEFKGYWHGLRRLLEEPKFWPATAIYLCVTLLTVLRARSLQSRLHDYVWERDESSRGVGSFF